MGQGENEAFVLLDEMASNRYQWLGEKLNPKRVIGMVYVDAFTILQAQTNVLLLGLSKKIDYELVGINMVQNPFLVCEHYGELHASKTY